MPSVSSQLYQYSNALTRAHINDSIEADVLLDCGACVSLMNAQLARRLRLDIKPYGGRPVAGVQRTPLQIVGEAQVKLRICATDLYCVAGLVEDLEYAVLIGSPVLHAYGLIINYAKGVVHIGERANDDDNGNGKSQPIKIFQRDQLGPNATAAAATTTTNNNNNNEDLPTVAIGVISDSNEIKSEADEPNACAVRVRQSTYIEPHSFRWVDVAVRGKNGKPITGTTDGTVIAFDGAYEHTRASPLPGVISVHEGRATIAVINFTDTRIRLPKRTRIATFKSGEVPYDGNDSADTIDTGATASTAAVTSTTNNGPAEKDDAANIRDIKSLIEKVELGNSVTPEQRKQFQALLHEYADIFAPHKKRVSTAKRMPKIHIDTGNHPPINVRSYRRPPQDDDIIDAETADLLKSEVIRPSKSPWNSNIVLVKKADGTRRVCLDLRPLNAITKRDCYPLPRIDATIEALHKAKWFSTLDAQSGFWQLELDDSSAERTAFRTRTGQYEWCRLPFGAVNSPAAFQRWLDIVLNGYTHQFAQAYVDDVALYSATFEDHLRHTRLAFERFRYHGLQLKWEKCCFARESIRYLGHIITREGISPDPAKTEAVEEIEAPRTVRQVRRFLGAAGYYRSYIPNFATIAEPLTELTKAHARFTWGDAEQKAFDTLRTALVSKPVLAFPDQDKPYTLTTDASNVGIAAVLSQPDEHGNLRPVAYASKKLTDAERNYHSTEKEALAIVWALRAFRTYLLGAELTVETDCQAAVYIFNSKEPTGRIARWLVEVAEFSPLRIKHRKGSTNVVADALSRAPVENSWYTKAGQDFEGPTPQQPKLIITDGKTETIITLPHTINDPVQPAEEATQQHQQQVMPAIAAIEPVAAIQQRTRRRRTDATDNANATTTTTGPTTTRTTTTKPEAEHIREIRHAQESDTYTQRRLQYLKDGTLPPPTTTDCDDTEREAIKRETRDMYIINGLLYIRSQARGMRKRDKRPMQLVVPQSMQEDVMRVAHESLVGGHMGLEKTVDKIRNEFYWPRMYSDVSHWVESCTVCQQRKSPTTINRGEPQSITASRPFELLAMDVLSLTPASNGACKVLVITDHWSRYAWTVPLADESQDTIARAFIDTIILQHGAPEKLLTDRGAPFLSTLNQNLYKMCGIKKLNTSPLHPQSNGKCERQNRTLCNILASYVSDRQNDWPAYLQAATAAYNHAIQASTHESPYYLMHLRDPIAPNAVGTHIAQEQYATVDDFRVTKLRELEEAKKRVAENELYRAERQESLQHRQPQGKPFVVGQLVLRRTPNSYDGRTTKLAREWQGPYRVAEVIDSNTVRLYNPRTQAPDTTPINVNILKHYIEYKNTEARPEHPNSNAEQEDDDEQVYEIDRILKHRDKYNKRQYLVKWRGYTNRSNSWVDASQVDADELVQDYNRELDMATREPAPYERPTTTVPTRRSTRTTQGRRRT